MNDLRILRRIEARSIECETTLFLENYGWCLEKELINVSNYLTEVSDLFLRRRGSTLSLSPLDWQMISEWELQGIPLPVVCRAINDVFDKYYQQPQRKQRPIKSIAYCAEEIDDAFTMWSELQVGK